LINFISISAAETIKYSEPQKNTVYFLYLLGADEVFKGCSH